MANQTHRTVNRVSCTYWTINMGPNKTGFSCSMINGWIFAWKNNRLIEAKDSNNYRVRV